MRTERLPNDALRVAADDARAQVDRVGRVEGRAIHDPQLNAALEPLRRFTLGAVCGDCERSVSWCAIDPGGAFVAAFQHRCPPRMRRGGTADCKLPYEAPFFPKAPWIMLAETGETTVTLVDRGTLGYPTRLQLTCPKCGAEHVARNTTRLTDFLTAVSRGESKLWLTD